jgi:hypothetical protein
MFLVILIITINGTNATFLCILIATIVRDGVIIDNVIFNVIVIISLIVLLLLLLLLLWAVGSKM